MLKRLLKWTGIAFGLFMAWFSWQLWWPAGPIRVSPETTFITAPLADDGLPNYSEYVLDQMREGVTPANNGAIPFIQAMWPAGLWGDDEKHLVCDELGMEVPSEAGLDSPYSNRQLMTELYEWCGGDPEPAGESADDELDGIGFTGQERDNNLSPDEALLDAVEEGPWTATDAEPIARWLAEHAPHFDLLYAAVEREKFYFPSPTLLADPKACFVRVMIPGEQRIRSAASCLKLRANLRLGSGDIRGAWDDCRVMYQLTDVSTHPTVLCEVISHNIEKFANALLLRILESPELTPELAEEIDAFLATRQPQHNMRDTLETGNRIDHITSLLEISDFRPLEESNTPDWVVPRDRDNGREPSIDWTTVLHIANQQYDLFLEAVDQPTYAEQQAALDAWYAEIQRKAVQPSPVSFMLSCKVRTEYMAYMLLEGYGDNFALRLDRQNRTHRQLPQTAVALARYQLATGEYPESLDGLMPQFLDKLPIDPFDRPIVYQRTSDGYLLYSLGPNCIDDRGNCIELRTLQGYPIPDDEAAEMQLRKKLGEPALDVEVDNFHNDDVLVIDTTIDPELQTDDIAIRLPLLQRPIPKFERVE
ncbi:hypothetical protein NG895_13845 [Aeoliella sp. ICT_H6.2]|uniref:Uncharacterized protein n=1 Tax=Aeoliella straminimaris TaxID=2954799 RepID=A0A9X2FB43_9BACT|nr:hypothetical protein [Aeoliella straminimaris]MCO6044988.1 hypothetical protein [Aeoliella straminimaris]